MAETTDLELEQYGPHKRVRRAHDIMRRIEALAKHSRRGPFEVFEILPKDTQEVIAYLFETCQFEDHTLTGHLSEPEKDKLVNFQGLIMPYVEVTTNELEHVDTGQQLPHTAMTLPEVISQVSEWDAVAASIGAIRRAHSDTAGY